MPDQSLTKSKAISPVFASYLNPSFKKRFLLIFNAYN